MSAEREQIGIEGGAANRAYIHPDQRICRPGRSKIMESKVFAGKTLLITGGTGTFGNAVVDQAGEAGFNEIRIFSRDEKKQEEMTGEESTE